MRDALKRYRIIEKTGGWLPVDLEKDHKAYKPNDTSGVIQQIRDRLFITGELKQNNRSNVYDAEFLLQSEHFNCTTAIKLTLLFQLSILRQ